MSYVPTGGTTDVSTGPNSGIVVSGGNLLTSGLVAGSNITLTADPAFGGKGLRIDAVSGDEGNGVEIGSSHSGEVTMLDADNDSFNRQTKRLPEVSIACEEAPCVAFHHHESTPSPHSCFKRPRR